MEYEITFKADHNDADYVHNIATVDEEDLEKVKKIVEKIAKWKGTPYAEHENWPNSFDSDEDVMEMHNLTQEEFEYIDEYIPYVERGIHTLVEVSYITKPERTFLLGKE